MAGQMQLIGRRHAPIRLHSVAVSVTRGPPELLPVVGDPSVQLYTLDRFQVETPDLLDDRLFEVRTRLAAARGSWNITS